MKRIKLKILTFCLLILLTRCSEILNQSVCEPDIDTKSYCFKKDKIDSEEIGENISSNIFIGESFDNNLIFVEPFEFDNHDHSEDFKFFNIRRRMTAFAFTNSVAYKINGKFIEHSKLHLPNIYDKPKYFSMTTSEPIFELLKYKVDEKIKNNSIVFGVFDIDFDKADCSIYGKKRPFSKEEYDSVLEELKEDQEIAERTLDFKSYEETILNAKYICKIQNSKSKTEISLSFFETKGMEYAGTVYIADLYKDKKFIKTIEKYNYDGPY
ncbi:hypothetical protein [Leptospira meyeri]|uniref:hypothetical protein n=1 Tax=Leptospira meyeri TaxID=29508 RepID=UPI001FB020FB|nr:hypothetical protein [Leptospira meyeri]